MSKNKRTLLSLAFTCGIATAIPNAIAAETYNANNSYTAGSEVEFNGITYRAKWWANSGQSPADAQTNSWGSPWEVVKKIPASPPPNTPSANTLTPSTNNSADQHTLYVEYSAYNSGDIVTHNGQAYRCKAGVANWCSGPAWAYGPGTGTAWETAWQLLDRLPINNHDESLSTNHTANNTTTPANGSHAQYVEYHPYNSGDVVSAQGQFYQCRGGVSAWCAGPAWAYEPGAGSAWQQAWALVDNPVQSDTPARVATTTPPPQSTPTSSPSSPNSTATGGFSISNSALQATEAELTAFPEMQMVKDAIATRDNGLVEQISPLNPTNPSNVQRIERIMSEQDWDYLFPLRSPEYTYRRFLQASGKFPAWCGDYDDGRDADYICRITLATAFAHFAQETGGHESWRDIPEWRQALVHVREMGWDEHTPGGYNGECNPAVWQGQTWPCGTWYGDSIDPNLPFNPNDYKSYFGRGAKQLSYNYNYGPFSEAMFGDVSVLMESPSLVADTWLNLASAIFFYVYPQPPKPSMLHVIDGTWQPNHADLNNGLVPGFGVTIQIINGGVECGGSDDVAQGKNRIQYYREFAQYFAVDIPHDEVLGCANMKQFDDSGAGALPIYWEKDWSWRSDTNANGDAFACQLKGYQTPHSAFKAGDYAKCVQYHFPSLIITN